MTEQQPPDRPAPLWGPSVESPPAERRVEPPRPPAPSAPAPPAPRPSRPRPRTTPLLVGAAVVCVLGGVIAVAVIRSHQPEEPAAADRPLPPVAEVVPEHPASPTTTEASAAPSPPAEQPGHVVPVVPVGFRLVSGPDGIAVAIPEDWTVRSGAVPSNLQADAPHGDGLVRFGGSAAPAEPLLDVVASNETGNPNIADGYQRLRLESVAGYGNEAVDWEFTFHKDGEYRHSQGRYWRLDGIDYVVYASAPDTEWASVSPVVAVMIETARPR